MNDPKEREALEEKVEKTMDKMFGDEPNPNESYESTSEQTDEVEDEQTDETQETDESTSEQTDESESKDESTSESSDETSEKAETTDEIDDSKAGEKPELTQAEIRAAIHLGWTEKEVKELAQANPELAKKTCAKALESTNSLSKKFSELGKAKAAKPPEPEQKPKPERKAIDFEALEKEYKDDPIVGVLKQVVEQNETLSTEVNALRSSGTASEAKINQARVQEDAAISQQIDTFFSRPDVSEYKDTYGVVKKGSKDWDDLTQGQIKKRWEVVEQASLILDGAKQQGMEMPLDEAFERAHLLVTEDVREQMIRKKIKASAVKRSKTLTLEPTNVKKQTPSSGAKKGKAFESKVGQQLQKVFRS